MALKVIDKTGRLPRNPKDWPDELKKAVAECCCGESSTATGIGLSCCQSALSYSSFCVTISGGSSYDGTYTLTYQTNQVVARSNSFGGFGGGCISTETLSDGWFSDWVVDCRSTCSIPVTRHRIWMQPASDGVASCAIHHSTESPARALGCTGALDIATDVGHIVSMFPLTPLSLSCSPLAIVWKNVLGLPSCACPALVSPVYATLTECS